MAFVAPRSNMAVAILDPGESLTRTLQIATVGENVDAILMGVRAFPVTRIDLLHVKEFTKEAASLQNRFAQIKLDTRLHPIGADMLIATLRTVSEIVKEAEGRFDEILVNVGAGPRMMTCSLLSAAFVNGLMSFDCMNEAPVFLPVLKFSYTELVSEAKLAILAGIEKLGGQVDSLAKLSEVSGIEPPLLSYHVRGGRDSKGLEPLGLVKVDRGKRGKLTISLTPLGRLMVVGRG